MNSKRGIGEARSRKPGMTASVISGEAVVSAVTAAEAIERIDL
ncbi:MAG: hypothetical protein AABM43_08815 [Actinomycetota bacterium]